MCDATAVDCDKDLVEFMEGIDWDYQGNRGFEDTEKQGEPCSVPRSVTGTSTFQRLLAGVLCAYRPDLNGEVNFGETVLVLKCIRKLCDILAVTTIKECPVAAREVAVFLVSTTVRDWMDTLKIDDQLRPYLEQEVIKWMKESV